MYALVAAAGLGALPEAAVGAVGDSVMTTVGDEGTVTVLGMVWVDVVGVARVVMDTLLVMLGIVIVTLLMIVDEDAPASGAGVAPMAELSVVAL